MGQSFEELRDRQEIDQALAEMLEQGSIRIVGKMANGDDQLQLTAKGTTRAAVMVLEGLITGADRERRDFTQEEKSKVLEQIWAIREALLKR
jgi:CRISPR/Cas system type I-B associated protein Csh2 (Cas7 group RAMP superfamily)